MERLKCNLTFRELGKDENLYDDVDLTAGSMVDAQYRRVADMKIILMYAHCRRCLR